MLPEKNPAANPDSSSIERILATAETLFGEIGFDATSMSAIAAHAGVSKANIFHHFKSKQELYQAVLANACKEARERIDRLEQTEGKFVDQLEQFVASHLQGILEHSNLTRLVLRDLLENGEQRGKKLAEQAFGPNFTKLVDILHHGQTRDELRSDVDPAMVALMLIAANVYYFHSGPMLRHFTEVDFADDPKIYSKKLVQLMLHGILPPSQDQTK